MSARLAGIGLLSVIGLSVGAAAGYLAIRTEAPAQADVQAAPEPPAVAVAPADFTTTAAAPPVPTPAIRSDKKVRPSEPETPVVTREVKPAVERPNPVATPSPEPAVIPAVPPPAIEPPAATPVPTPVEQPRYTPDPVPTPTAAQEPPKVEFEGFTVARHSVIGIRLDGPVSTRTARVEDRVTATVSRDVTVGGRTAIAAGVRLEGTVVLVERGGRFKNRPRLGLKFDRLILADGTRVSLDTDTIYREGDSPTADATAKVGTGAVAGAILGAVIGGKKGAAIGGVAGAAGGVATVMRGEQGEASLPAGAPLTVRLTEDVAILINR